MENNKKIYFFTTMYCIVVKYFYIFVLKCTLLYKKIISLNCLKYIFAIVAFILAVLIMPVNQRYTSRISGNSVCGSEPLHEVCGTDTKKGKADSEHLDTTQVVTAQSNNLTYWYISIDTYPYGKKQY
ncbi:MAG: hypothetical protein R6W78_02565 [Bacteroidales bacterium]